MLPGLNGFEVLRRIPTESKVAVADAHRAWRRCSIALSDWKSALTTTCQSLSNPPRAVARIRAILRRAKADDARDEIHDHAAARTLTVRDIKIDMGTREVN